MRIISGKYKSRIINAPRGLDVRPTTDRVREAMFSSLISIYGNLDNACVLDAFAGSGALGFESISRGAKKLFSFENNKKTYENLLNNFKSLNENDAKVKIIYGDVTKYKFDFLCNGVKFDILFFDPPYDNSPIVVLEILKELKSSNLNKNAVVVYEHSAANNFEEFKKNFESENFVLKNAKIYGEIAVEFLIYK